MKAPLFVIGFTSLLTLMLCGAFGEAFAIILAVFFSFLVFVSIFGKNARKEYRIFLVSVITIIASSINFILQVNLSEKVTTDLVNLDADIRATLVELPEEAEGRYSYVFRVDSLNLDGHDFKHKFKTKIFSSTPLDIEPYQRIEASVHFSAIEDDGKYFGSKNYFRSNKIYINAVLKDFNSFKILDRDTASPYYYALASRKNMVENINLMLPPKEAALVNAVVFGQKQELDRDIKSNLELCGVSHMLAPSGFHMSILFAIIYYLVIKITKYKKIATSISSIAILIFMAIIGFPVSAVRSGCMIIFACLSTLVLKKIDSLNALGLVTILICFINPFAPGNIGFVLSFFATFALIVFLPRLYGYFREKFKIKDEDSRLSKFLFSMIHKMATIVIISIIVTIMTFPFIAISFGRVSLISPIANLVLSLPMSMLMLCSMAMFLLYFFKIPILLQLVAVLSKMLADFPMNISCAMAKLPFASMVLSQRLVFIVISAITILMAAFISMEYNKRLRNMFAILAVFIVFISNVSYNISHRDCAEVSFLSMGNTATVLVKNKDINSLISFGNSLSAGKNINNSLALNQIKYLDFVLVSDSDSHALDAARSVIKKYEPKCILMQEFCKSASLVDNSMEDKSNIKYYTESAEITLTNDLHIEIKDYGQHKFIKFELYGKHFLVCINGGDANKIPETWRKCDFFVFNKTPKHVSLINCDYAIISMYDKQEEKFLEGELPLTSNIISNTKNFGLKVEINPNGDQKIAKL